MRSYSKDKKREDYFNQGFRLGLVFGVLGAIIMLGRDHSPQQTIPERIPAEPVLSRVDTSPEVVAAEAELEIIARPTPAPSETIGPIAQG